MEGVSCGVFSGQQPNLVETSLFEETLSASLYWITRHHGISGVCARVAICALFRCLRVVVGRSRSLANRLPSITLGYSRPARKPASFSRFSLHGLQQGRNKMIGWKRKEEDFREGSGWARSEKAKNKVKLVKLINDSWKKLARKIIRG